MIARAEEADRDTESQCKREEPLRVVMVTDRESLAGEEWGPVLHDKETRRVLIAASHGVDAEQRVAAAAYRRIVDALEELPGVVVERGKYGEVVGEEDRVVPGVWVASDEPLYSGPAGRVLLVTRDRDTPIGMIALVIPGDPTNDRSVQEAVALAKRMRADPEGTITSVSAGGQRIIDLRGCGSLSATRPAPRWLFALQLLPCLGSGRRATAYRPQHAKAFCPFLHREQIELRNSMILSENRSEDRIVGEVTASGDIVDLGVEDYAGGGFVVKSVNGLVARRARERERERRTAGGSAARPRVLVDAETVRRSKRGRVGVAAHVDAR